MTIRELISKYEDEIRVLKDENINLKKHIGELEKDKKNCEKEIQSLKNLLDCTQMEINEVIREKKHKPKGRKKIVEMEIDEVSKID